MTLTRTLGSLTESELVRFRQLVRKGSGIELPGARGRDLERAVEQGLADTGARSPRELLERLVADGDGGVHLEAFIARLTIGETHFFRNRPIFEALEHEVLPELIDQRRKEKRLRIWSAGCSSGEEPYSLAILLDRLLPSKEEWNVSILGTDINRQSLAKAKRGEYGRWSFREVPPKIQSAYFRKREEQYSISTRIREMVTFSYLNLALDPYPSLFTKTQAMDMVLCRNVLIYFSDEMGRSVVSRLTDSLVEGGWLVVASTETPLIREKSLAPRSFPRAVLHQKIGLGEDVRTSRALPLPVSGNGKRPRAHRPISKAPERVAHAPASPQQRLRPPAAKPGPDVPSGPGPAHLEALALWEAGHSEDSLIRFTELAKADLRDCYAPYLAAKICANELRLDAALGWAGVALERDKLFAPAHYLHGLVLQQEGKARDAQAALRRCVYLKPDFALGHFALAQLLGQAGDARRAAKSLKNVTKLLEGRPRDELVPEGDGVTVGRLLELTTVHQDLLSKEGRS